MAAELWHGRTVAEGWWFEPQFEYKSRNYYNSDDYQLATEIRSASYLPMRLTGPGNFRKI